MKQMNNVSKYMYNNNYLKEDALGLLNYNIKRE